MRFLAGDNTSRETAVAAQRQEVAEGADRSVVDIGHCGPPLAARSGKKPHIFHFDLVGDHPIKLSTVISPDKTIGLFQGSSPRHLA